MLPERLSTDLTSLNEHEDRLAVVTEIVVSSDGALKTSEVYPAVVRNQAKLAYNAVGAWLIGGGPLPPAAANVRGMDEQLRMQDRVAQSLSEARHRTGALDFETIEVEHVFDGDTLRDVQAQRKNRAKALIENLMIAANGVTARFLDARGFPSLRRVVKSPERWERIRNLAEEMGEKLPPEPDSIALSALLARRRQQDPDTFPDFSRSIIQLLGSGEYVVDPPGTEPPGHFGLAVRDYTHSTAPNRRYPDLLTQRLLKATLAGRPSPYSLGELEQLAAHCTQQEDAANKVERQVRKAAAALVVESRVGETFQAFVTGASSKGTWVRVPSPPVEGKLVHGERGLDVGDRVRVRLAGVNVERGFIDFERT
jgi:exoribonuclease-2